MQDKVTYEYAVIRVVPKVEREEFLNVGVILFSKRKKYLGIRYHIDEKRLKAFSADLDPDMLKNYLEAWEKVCQGGKEGGCIGQLDLPSRFRWLVASRSTIIQSSKTHPGLCHNPEQVLENLFQSKVL
ncbi:DUF3037 domain-containing protein [Flammeovirgaceae bacterium SG7u.111]|nr:DUF3037 domain-containing protein [Flammeovirgaceae bacterium SG7u.132]WPO34201.1 DUF3037 domain-containing protein [Flammeovirgaceae bacterium SG7u.111]